ncbi:hypothetical protein HAX54_051011 [Datura stramonium]|uniref:Pentatricopeptide repeat-containing protein n=1 Tax=Datura stramonium TaxID=4076 RepID=A0ABS8RR71_DATST|nr:hypothetical protein [Datura stramonium]
MRRIPFRAYSSSHSNTVKGKLGVSSDFDMKEVKCLDDAVTLFRQMVRTKPLPSVVDFYKLFNTMINMKHYSSVVSLFRKMQQWNGIPFNVVTFSTLIRGFFAENKVKHAVELFKKLGAPSPAYLNYSIVIDALCKMKL